MAGRKTLSRLLDIQEKERDEAHKRVMGCLAEEDSIIGGIRTLQERTAAPRHDTEDEETSLMIDSHYRLWLPVAYQQIHDLEVNLSTAKKRTEEARAVLTNVIRKMKTTEIMVNNMDARIKIKRDRNEQNELDDMSISSKLLGTL